MTQLNLVNREGMPGTTEIYQPWYAKAQGSERNFAVMWVTLYPDLDLWAEQLIIPGRKFRFDFVHYPSKVAIEIQGFGPGHHSAKGVARDNQKDRLAAELGYQVIPFDTSLLGDESEYHRVAKIIRSRI